MHLNLNLVLQLLPLCCYPVLEVLLLIGDAWTSSYPLCAEMHLDGCNSYLSLVS